MTGGGLPGVLREPKGAGSALQEVGGPPRERPPRAADPTGTVWAQQVHRDGLGHGAVTRSFPQTRRSGRICPSEAAEMVAMPVFVCFLVSAPGVLTRRSLVKAQR